MAFYGEIAHSDVGMVNGSLGPSTAESVDIAETTRNREIAYQRQRFALLCDDVHHIAGRGMLMGKMYKKNKGKILKYLLYGLIAYYALRGLRR